MSDYKARVGGRDLDAYEVEQLEKERNTPLRGRSDVHRPSVLDPADYEDVGYFDTGGAEDGGDEWIEPEYADKRSVWDDGAPQFRCDHCGHSARYFEVFFHAPSDRLVFVGMTCAKKLGLSSIHEAQMREAAERRKLAKVRGRFLAGNPRARQAIDWATDHFVAVREAYAEDGLAEDHGLIRTNNFLYDLAQKFERYGSLSEKQIEAAWWAAERQRQHEIRSDLWEQERAAEREQAEPVPETEERIEIAGVVVKAEFKDNDFGGRFVMTVKDDRGFLVWGTQPDAIGDAEKGDRVRFMARVERSDRDEFFGFFQRPTKAEVTETAEVEEEPKEEPEEAETVTVRTYYGVTMGAPSFDGRKLLDRFEHADEAEIFAAKTRSSMKPEVAAIFPVCVEPVGLDVEIGGTIAHEISTHEKETR